MATSKKAAANSVKIASKVAAGFPAKVSNRPNGVEFDEAKHMAREAVKAKKPTRAKKAVAKPDTKVGAAAVAEFKAAAKASRTAAKPAVKAATKPAVKRVVADCGLPLHEATTVTQLVSVLNTFPRGATFEHADGGINVYNLRGKLVAVVRKVAKPAKGAKK